MEPPIIVISDDLQVFDSFSEAERYLETVDVAAQNPLFYDRHGRVLTAVIIEKRSMLFRRDSVALRYTVPAQIESERLHKLLEGYLKGTHHWNPEDSDADLDALVSIARIWARCE